MTPDHRGSIAHAYQVSPRSVAAMAKDFADGETTPPHQHPRGQLIHAVSGVMRVTTSQGMWIAPPHRALWVPAGVTHSLRMCGAVSMRTLFIRPDAAPLSDRCCKLVVVTGLLRELILAATEIPPEAEGDARSQHMTALILMELRALDAQKLLLPMPTDARVLRVCEALLADPSGPETLEIWGERVGASGRTLSRLFQRETGMRFSDWRRQAQLAAGLTQLAQGRSVEQAAQAAGFERPSAFTAMFRKAMGATPTAFFQTEPSERT